MNRSILKGLHAVASMMALLLPLVFVVSTVAVEVTGDVQAIAAVKRLIAYGLLLLVPAMAVAGFTGSRLAGRSQAPPVRAKRRRTRFIATNGLLVLVPCALALHILASAGSLGPAFYIVQAVELVAGPVNIVLLSLNARDGLRLSGRLPKKALPTTSRKRHRPPSSIGAEARPVRSAAPVGAGRTGS